MSGITLSRTLELVRICCSNLKSFLFTRQNFDHANNGTCVPRIDPDLSNPTNLYAWQRNHMANERTFLAWCRTGISLIAFGFVIERFDILIREMQIFSAKNGVPAGPPIHLHSTRLMGLIALGLGVVIIVLAGWRFFYIRRHINRGDTNFSVVPDTFLLSSILITVAGAFIFFAFYF